MRKVAVTLFALYLIMIAVAVSQAQAAKVDLRHAYGYGTCWGCASASVKAAVRAYILAHAGSRAACVSYRESGYNPSAISHTNDHSIFQWNWSAWHGSRPDLFDRANDVIYQVAAFNQISNYGRDMSPWSGGTYAC